MSRVLAEVVGKLATLLGYDGTDFRNVHVDAAGDLQVDVLTTAMDALAATAANQATMITALQLIDDLRNALHTVGTDELHVLAGLFGAAWKGIHVDVSGDPQVDVLSSALPTGASTAAHQVTMITALQLIDDLRGALDSVGTDELDVNVEASVLPTGASTSDNQATLIAKFQDQAFTYKDRYAEGGSNDAHAAGGVAVSLTAVPAGEVWMIQGILAYDVDAATTSIELGVKGGGVEFTVQWTGTPGANQLVLWTGEVVLKEADYVRCYFSGTGLNDRLRVKAWGWKMSKAP